MNLIDTKPISILIWALTWATGVGLIALVLTTEAFAWQALALWFSQWVCSSFVLVGIRRQR
jgi:hypothetical protein